MRIGFIVAMENEYAPFLSSLGELLSESSICGIGFAKYRREKNTVFLAKCGIGEVASSVASAILIGHFDCEYILNFGLVGALVSLPSRTVAIVRDVVHYDCDLTPFGHPLGAPDDLASPFLSADPRILDVLADKGLPALRLASGDKFIANERRKQSLVSCFSADICDMEGAGIALTCTRAHVPFTMIKVVSDGAGEDAVACFEGAKTAAFSFAVSTVLSAIEEVE